MGVIYLEYSLILNLLCIPPSLLGAQQDPQDLQGGDYLHGLPISKSIFWVRSILWEVALLFPPSWSLLQESHNLACWCKAFNHLSITQHSCGCQAFPFCALVPADFVFKRGWKTGRNPTAASCWDLHAEFLKLDVCGGPIFRSTLPATITHDASIFVLFPSFTYRINLLQLIYAWENSLQPLALPQTPGFHVN